MSRPQHRGREPRPRKHRCEGQREHVRRPWPRRWRRPTGVNRTRPLMEPLGSEHCPVRVRVSVTLPRRSPRSNNGAPPTGKRSRFRQRCGRLLSVGLSGASLPSKPLTRRLQHPRRHAPPRHRQPVPLQCLEAVGTLLASAEHVPREATEAAVRESASPLPKSLGRGAAMLRRTVRVSRPAHEGPPRETARVHVCRALFPPAVFLLHQGQKEPRTEAAPQHATGVVPRGPFGRRRPRAPRSGHLPHPPQCAREPPPPQACSRRHSHCTRRSVVAALRSVGRLLRPAQKASPQPMPRRHAASSNARGAQRGGVGRARLQQAHGLFKRPARPCGACPQGEGGSGLARSDGDGCEVAPRSKTALPPRSPVV